MSREAKVGIFVLVGLLILTYFTFRVSRTGGIGDSGYILTVDFDTAAGLEPKANVKMAGVPIGKVEEIRLAGTKARLVLRIDKGVQIPLDSVASIQTQGVLGEKYVEIIPGKQADRIYPPGGRIANTLPPTNLDEIIRKVDRIGDDVKKFTEALAGAVGTEEGKKALADIIQNVRETTVVLRNVVTGNEERFNRILANVDRLSGDLKDIASANKEDVRTTIANLRAFSETLKTETPELARKLNEMSTKISDVVGENKEGIHESLENLRRASAKLDNTLDSAGKVMAKIERGEGTLGKLVNDNTTAVSLNDTLEGINKYVRKSENLKTFIDYRLEYNARTYDFKHYVNLRLQPSADKYYVIGLVDDPRGKFHRTEQVVTTDGVTTHTTKDTTEDKLKITGYIAKRFSGLTIRGGVLESTGGVGLDYDLLGGRVTIGAEIFDFTRNDLRPHLKAYGNYDIVKNLFITGGVDDILNPGANHRSFFVGGGIKFSDEDIKTVIGAVPIRP